MLLGTEILQRYKMFCFQGNKVQAKKTKLKNIMDEIISYDDKIKDTQDTYSRKIQAEQNRDQDINLAQQQKCKLENDLSRMIDEIGSGSQLA